MVFKSLLSALLVASLIAATLLGRGISGPRRSTTLDQILFSSERVKVMTWNVGRARLGSDTRARWDDIPHIAQVIDRENPDVVALQELDGRSQARTLASHLRGGYEAYASRALAILVRRGHRVRSAFTVHTRTGGRALAVIFDKRKLSKPIACVSLHADPFNARNRRLYIEDIVDQVRTHHDGYALLAGDFNFDIAADAKRDSLSEGLTHDSESYTVLSRYFVDAARAAAATALLDRRLDYVFVRPRTSVPVNARVLGGAVGDMDHQPLVVLADLRARPRFSLGH